MEQEIKPITMTANEAAQYVGISYWLILEMTKQNKIPFIACGSRKLFRKAALDKWMEDSEACSVTTPVVDSTTAYGKLRKIQ